jgi:hypothetical protein
LAGGEQYGRIMIETRGQNTENQPEGHNNQLEEDGTMGKRGPKRSPQLEKATKQKNTNPHLTNEEALRLGGYSKSKIKQCKKYVCCPTL